MPKLHWFMVAGGRFQLSVIQFGEVVVQPVLSGFASESVGVVSSDVQVVALPNGGFVVRKVKLFVWLGL
jgi:hypothetical protein